MTSKKPGSLQQKLFRYGLGAGAASLAASAQAAIQYSGALTFTGDQVYFDMQNTVGPSAVQITGVDDFGFTSSIASKGKTSVTGQGAPTYGAVAFEARGLGGNDYGLKFGAGTTIGSQNFSTSAFFNDYYAGGLYSPPGQGLGDWHPGDRGFLGLEFIVNSQNDFGWADVTFNGFNSMAGGVFTLNGYAYEDSGTSIVAGAIPEPSTFMLLAAGAVGVALLKRRRQAKN